MVTDLTGMGVANASLLDEGTAAGEAMTLFHRVQARKLGDDAGVFLVSDGCFPQTIEVLRSRAEPLGIELRIGPADQMIFDARVFGAWCSTRTRRDGSPISAGSSYERRRPARSSPWRRICWRSR